MTSDGARLRIACSGLVAADHGSVSSAGFVILRELLRRGHEIVLFSTKAYVYPVELIEGEGLGYVDCTNARIDRVVARFGSGRAGWVAAKIAHRLFTRRIMRAMRQSHAQRAYSVELFLGTWAFGRVPGLPVVSWVQGPPGTDARSIHRHRRDILRLCGRREYAQLRAYAIYRSSRLGRPVFRHTDICICGSASSARMLVDHFGLDAERVRTLPYPIDLEVFAPLPGRPCGQRSELLWVGRVVPRKRLDLFLDAGALLIASGRDVRLTVIGGFAFADGYRQLLDEFPYPDRLTYVPRLSRDEVRDRLQTATVLVQPSEEENFGSSVAEALACETPVVVGPTNGTGDYVGAGGVIFDEYAPTSVAAAIAAVLHDTARDPARVHVAARQAAVDHLAVVRVADGLERAMAWCRTSATNAPTRAI